jgi:hypothetical protein
MIIRKGLKSVSNIQQQDPQNISEGASEVVKASNNGAASLNYTESFSDLPHPTAVDKMLLPASEKMLLPASPQIDRQGSTVAELRDLITAAKAHQKPPFSESNLNRLLARNQNSYQEITGDLKNWVNNNLYLTPRQKGEFERMPESSVKQIQVLADKATEMGKLIEVEIRDDDKSNPLTSNFEKTIRYEDVEIAENVIVKLNKGRIMPHPDFEQFNTPKDLNVEEQS